MKQGIYLWRKCLVLFMDLAQNTPLVMLHTVFVKLVPKKYVYEIENSFKI